MPFYIPVQNARAFRRLTRYDQINWKDLRAVVDAFHGRIDDWYILPTKVLISHPDGGHFVFPIMAMNCLLIDMLSQFYFGNDLSPTELKDPKNKLKNPVGGGTLESSGAKFRDFLVDRLRHLTGPLAIPIKQPITRKNSKPTLDTFQDVLWGFRCGIMHQAATPLYALISGIPTVFEFRTRGVTTYADGTPCPAVVYFPQKLFNELENAFNKYLDDLLNPDPALNDLRRRFKDKFEDSFGVTISATV